MAAAVDEERQKVGEASPDEDVPETRVPDADGDGHESGQDLPQTRNDSLSQASASTQGSTVSSNTLMTGRTQCLRFETITDRESRMAVLAMKAVIILGVLGAVALVTVKYVPGAEGLIVMNRNFILMQVIGNAVLLAALVLGFSIWIGRVASSRRHKMTWSTRRARVAQLAGVRGVLVLGIVAGQLAMNSHILAHPGAFCHSYLLPLLDALIWMGWNCMLLTLVIEAHGTNLVLDPKRRRPRHDTVVFDLPLWVHWPKLLLLWLPFTVSVVWATALGMDDGHGVRIEPRCTWGAHVDCSVNRTFRIVSQITYIGVAAYFSAYAFRLRLGWRHLRKQQYQTYRMPNLALRFQMRFNGSMMSSLFAGLTMTALLGSSPCINYTTTFLGNIPVSLIFVFMQLGNFYFSFPRPHDYLEVSNSLPEQMLQQFAWTEADVPRRRAAWKAALAPPPSEAPAHSSSCDAETAAGVLDGPALSAAAPLFCFETAIKLFFWAVLVYAYQEEAESGDASLAAMPAPIREILGEMDAAMRLFGLRKRRLFYDRACGTKALVAWSDSVILLSFRGTKEMANFVQDAKFLQTPHPPVRKFKGRTPCVHKGFLTTWHAPGVHDSVLSLVRDLLAAAPNPDKVRVLCTGHSLGGAVAQLASFDIVRELDLPPAQMSVYTFGCPRIGNRALAAETAEVVPHTWHVINDQDAVTKGMKLFGFYKRAGHRAIINEHGDLIVRPAHFELSMLQVTFLFRSRSAANHATVDYQRAFIAILTAQLRGDSRHADGLHGLLGLLKQLPQVRQALESHARRLGTSFPAMLRSIAASTLHAAHPAASASSPAAAGPAFSSQRFTPSRHASLLRAACSPPMEGVEVVADTDADAESWSVEEVVHVSVIDDGALNYHAYGAAMADATVVVNVHAAESAAPPR